MEQLPTNFTICQQIPTHDKPDITFQHKSTLLHPGFPFIHQIWGHSAAFKFCLRVSVCRLHPVTFCQSCLLYIVLFLNKLLLRLNFLLKILPGPLPLLSVDLSCLLLLPLSGCQPLLLLLGCFP